MRHTKIKMKISEQFCGLKHALKFFDITFYIGAAYKNGVSAFVVPGTLFKGNTDIIFG